MRLQFLTAFFIFFLWGVSFSFDGTTLYLQNEIYISTNQIPLCLLVSPEHPFFSHSRNTQKHCANRPHSTLIDYTITVEKSKIFSNKKIYEILSLSGFSNFTVVGSSCEIKKISNPVSFDKFYQNFVARYPEFDISRLRSFFPGNTHIHDYRLMHSQTPAELEIDYIIFNNGIGEKHLRTFLIYPDKTKVVQSEPKETPAPQFFVENIRGNFADLVYQHGAIYIRTKAKIIQRLDDSTFLVENINSRKRIKAKALP
jgi:hypothetical protein